jgi:hypothetical protein
MTVGELAEDEMHRELLLRESLLSGLTELSCRGGIANHVFIQF